MKNEIRKKLLIQRDSLTKDKRDVAERTINQKVWELILKREVKVLHCYLPFRSEVSLVPILERSLKQNIKIICPKTLKNRKLSHLILSNLESVEKGLYDTPYPAGNKLYQGSYDLILVPGAAFDSNGNRMGYGGGYYDTFLAQHPEAYKVGICFSFQLIENVPVEPHDVKMDEIIAA